MNIVNYWICGLALLGSGFIYVYTIEPRTHLRKRVILDLLFFVCFLFFMAKLPIIEVFWVEIVLRILGFLFLVHFLHMGRVLPWRAAIYYAIWAFLSWQLLYELWIILWVLGADILQHQGVSEWILGILVFALGYAIIAITIGKWMPDSGKKKIGPRQFVLALVTFCVFQSSVLVPANFKEAFIDNRWVTIYLSQLLLAVLLYLQNELFKKSDIKQELEAMNLLWKKEQEQYKLSKENIALINQKCHDLNHQINAIRNASKDEIEQYLNELEESVHIYEAIVKTGNDVLDTILTEKSLYCKDKEITVSCVADGSQLDFINTVDLYALLGNALDNAIEAVEKLEQKDMRQIDVLIYRQQNFLAINVINPMKETLEYEDELPVTTKGNRDYHGYGLKSMKYIVKKYEGFLNIKEEDGCFSLMILIPVPMST